ncbi:hypothetical protein LTR56_003458 [Elasticomyces elasticus]|nr:hypothetical protein LTR22_010934 [Elasticomyces elasticus]KAK3655452.1 hypothetical protein LTR56_003458 [Elasticomyces elasticus]KAK4919911.1 hypothetical protein LTR49_012509 [Elasticomyces elasticus]KAK5756707.1 hypothetical protein LTS12_013170 [Elasticomyces elasticus]
MEDIGATAAWQALQNSAAVLIGLTVNLLPTERPASPQYQIGRVRLAADVLFLVFLAWWVMYYFTTLTVLGAEYAFFAILDRSIPGFMIVFALSEGKRLLYDRILDGQ